MHRNILGNLHDPSGGVIIDLQCGDGTGEWTFGAAYEVRRKRLPRLSPAFGGTKNRPRSRLMRGASFAPAGALASVEVWGVPGRRRAVVVPAVGDAGSRCAAAGDALTGGCESPAAFVVARQLPPHALSAPAGDSPIRCAPEPTSTRVKTGAVPVVINSTVLPFSGAADEAALGIQWDACVVRVWAVEEIAGLPARLRGMTLREFHRRRLACRSIFRRVAGTRQAYQRAFFTLLRARVQEALLAAAGGAPPAERGAEEEAGGRGGRHNGGGGGRRQQLRQHQQQEQFAGGGAGGGTA